MKIWQLTPIDTTANDWRVSLHKERVIVRAESEDQARATATAQLKTGSEKIPRAPTPHSPWDSPTLVRCERLENSGYDENGPAAVLDPEL